IYCGTEIKKEVNIPVIAVNEIRKPEEAEYLVGNELVDMIAVGRGMLVDPDWAGKAQEGIPVNPCLKCEECKWFESGDKCPGRKKYNN
ncbi:MAG: NADH:flavin oxidoreductase, partial [Halanaerobiaceae bacterium]